MPNTLATDNLRRLAEARLSPAPPSGPHRDSALLYELQVHQIELEMQNEALQQAQQTLEAAYDRYVSLYDFSPLAYLTLSRDGRIDEANLVAAHQLGLLRTKLLQHCFSDFIIPADQDHWHRQVSAAWQSAAPIPLDGEIRLQHSDGRIFPVRLQGLRLDAAGQAPVLRLALTDISASKEAEASLRLAATVFANSDEAIIIADTKMAIIDVNPAFTRITGYSRDEAIGQTPKLLSSGRQGPAFYEGLWQALGQQDNWQGEIRNRRKNGEEFPEILSISTVRDACGQVRHYIGIFSDISRIKAHEAELDRIAHYDPLTGIPNRRLLADRLGQAIARARRSGRLLAVCYLDLDGFKQINDLHGHEVGDQLLIHVTERLQEVLRIDDTLARLGGDEFVLLINDLTHFEESQQIIERILAAVQLPTPISERRISISASIGATLYPDDDVDADTLIRHADQAMYRAKEAGKNRYTLFDREHDHQIQSHRQSQQRLREALHNRELVLYYQPKVNLDSGDIIGAEALIRWQHPEQGLLPPAAFLHYLNGCELEISVGEWVIDTALQQIADWQALGLTLGVSVNVSAEHLQHGDFSERLRQALSRHPEVAPQRLELEILETASLADMKQAAQVLTACRKLGVNFALDDFGTGYSSLTYFRNLPVQMLKIDQSFVRGMREDPNDLGIVDSVIRLAHAFNRPVIAEGVETLEHGAMLIQLGCPLAQGYGIARPMPAADIPAWVGHWQQQQPWLAIVKLPAGQSDLTLQVAAQSYRQWFSQINSHLARPAAESNPGLSADDSIFGLWYQGNGAARYGQCPEYAAIAPLHERIHQLAGELLALVTSGQELAGHHLLSALHATHEQLLSQLGRLQESLAAGISAARTA